jgi:beta-galactosidase GanA
MAFDDWKNAAPTTIWGDSAFPQGASSTVLVGLGTAATRSAAAGRPFWQAELGVADYHGTMIRTGRLPARWLEMWSWESIRQGAKGLLYWQFRKERHGNESGAYGLTDYGGAPSENARAVAAIGATLREHASLFATAQPALARVAILFSYQSYMMVWSQMRSCRVNVDALSGYYRMFWERNIPVDIVHEEQVTAESLAGYRLLILPMPLAISNEARVAVRGFVEQGGHVISEPFLCAYNADKALSTEVPGAGFVEVFGCRERDIRMAGEQPVTLQWGGRSMSVVRSHFHATWDLHGAEAIASYADGSPAVTRNRWGRGQAVMMGLNLGMSIAPQEGLGDDVLRAASGTTEQGPDLLVADLAHAAGVSAPLSAPDGIVASLLTADRNRTILIMINTNARPQSGNVRIDGVPIGACKDLMRGGATITSASTLEWDGYETRVLLIEQGLDDAGSST